MSTRVTNAIGTCSSLAEPCAGSPRYAAAAAAGATHTAYAAYAEDAHAASAASASAACAPASAPRHYPAPASASAPTAAASAPLGYPFIEPGSSHVFPVEDIECREADVGDFLLLESKQRSRCSRWRRSVRCRRNCGRCTASHRQRHPCGPPNRQGFLSTFPLRSLFRARHSDPPASRGPGLAGSPGPSGRRTVSSVTHWRKRGTRSLFRAIRPPATMS
jgi:hypothetical protein